MHNGLSFKFHFETTSYEVAHSLMPVIFEKVKQLQQANPGFGAVELSLFKPGNDRKTVILTVHTADSVIREESSEHDWEHALEIVFRHIEESSQHSIKLD
jgi:hypothetical protein